MQNENFKMIECIMALKTLDFNSTIQYKNLSKMLMKRN